LQQIGRGAAEEGRPRRGPSDSEPSTLPSRLSLTKSSDASGSARLRVRDRERPFPFLLSSLRHLPLGHSHRRLPDAPFPAPKSSAPHPMPSPVLRLLAAAPPCARGGRAGARRGDGGRTRLRLRVRAAAGEAAPPPSRTQVSRARCCGPPSTQPSGLSLTVCARHCF
jgi:hypothetical protein